MRHILPTPSRVFGVILSLLLAAASPLSAQSARPLVTIGQAFLADSDDPMRTNQGWSLQSHGIAEGLFRVDRNGLIRPHLAESVAPDGAGWLLRLADGRRFSDGSPVDAAAVAVALQRLNAGNPIAAAQTGKLTATVIDARTLRLSTERPAPVMAAVLAEWPFMIHKPTATGMLFTGPYRIVEQRPGDRIRLQPNPYFPDTASRPDIVIRRVPDPQARALGLESGELDLAWELAPDTLPRLRRNPAITLRSSEVAYQQMLFMNTRRPPLDDRRVRQAIDLALDRSMLALGVGAGTPATGIFPAFMPFAEKEPRPTDRAAAERLLDDAGWRRGAGGVREQPGRRLELTLVAYPQRPDFFVLAPIVKSQLESIGMRIATRNIEAITPALQAGEFDLGFWATHAAPGGDGASILERHLRSTAPQNFAGANLPALDAVLDRLGGESAVAARTALVRDAQAILFREVPVSFLLTPVVHVGLSQRLAGYRPFPSDYFIVQADMGLVP